MVNLTDWSEIDLCKGIQSNMAALPDEERKEVFRTYQTTAEIVRLYVLGLVTPKPAARHRLEDLYHASMNRMN